VLLAARDGADKAIQEQTLNVRPRAGADGNVVKTTHPGRDAKTANDPMVTSEVAGGMAEPRNGRSVAVPRKLSTAEVQVDAMRGAK